MAGELLLVVEDEERLQKLLERYLGGAGYRVATAKNGIEALALVRHTPPDLVLTDVNMPEMNGLELTRRLRSHHKTARIPVIMLSALKLPEEILAGYAVGADDYMAKPFELAVLGAKVQLLLRRAAERPAPADGARTRGGIVYLLRGKGGVGATTLAVNVAASLASRSAAAASILDLGLEFGGAAILLDLKPGPSLADLAHLRSDQLDDETWSSLVLKHASGIQMVVASTSPERAELVSVPAIQTALEKLRSSSDFVIVDAAPTFAEVNLAALDMADLVVVVTSPSVASVKAMLDCLRVLETLKIPARRQLIVMNRVTTLGATNQQLQEVVGRAADFVIPHSEAVEESANAGQPLVTRAPQNAAVHDYFALADRLAAMLEETYVAR
jgi:pilus assembly protein CpaE